MENLIKKIIKQIILESDNNKSIIANEYVKNFGVYNEHEREFYLNYKHIDKLKELGILYRVKPYNKIDFSELLKKFIKSKGYSVLVNDDQYYGTGIKLQLFNLKKFDVANEYSITKKELNNIKSKMNELIDKFNSIYRTSYIIDGVLGKKSDSSIQNSLLNKFSDGKIEKNEDQYELKGFKLKREEEDEYLVVVELDPMTRMPKII